jgi:hypothetical protein
MAMQLLAMHAVHFSREHFSVARKSRRRSTVMN